MRFGFFAVGAGCVTIAALYACASHETFGNQGYALEDASFPDSAYVFTEAAVQNYDAADQTQYPPSSVALGEGFACVVAKDHSVWCWGKNDVGQLGSDPTTMPMCGTTPCSPTPTQVQGLPPVTNLVAGDDFACALSGEKVWCWGSNAKNQLLGGSVLSRFTPAIVAEGSGAVVAAGQHACILTTDGFLHCWGDNTCNLFGRDDDAGISGAFKVPRLPAMKQVSLGIDEICTVDPTNELFCWGNDHKGSLGHDVTGAPLCNGLPFDPIPKQVAVQGPEITFNGAIEVHVGVGLACARKTDDSVWCWGDNSRGALGQGIPDTDPHEFPIAVPGITTEELVVAGQTACAIVANRPICWGDAQYGQLDSLGSDAGCGGTGCRPIGYVIPNQEPARDVFLGVDAIATIKTDLTLWTWGRNDFGQAAVAPTDSANTTCAGASTCIPDPRQVTTAPPLD